MMGRAAQSAEYVVPWMKNETRMKQHTLQLVPTSRRPPLLRKPHQVPSTTTTTFSRWSGFLVWLIISHHHVTLSDSVLLFVLPRHSDRHRTQYHHHKRIAQYSYSLALQERRSNNNGNLEGRGPLSPPSDAEQQQQQQQQQFFFPGNNNANVERHITEKGNDGGNEQVSQNSTTRMTDTKTGDGETMSRILQDELDLEREKTRLESFEAYVLVSILASSASFSVVDSLNRDAANCPEILFSGTLLVAGLSALCSLHATIVFALSTLYGKTALGLHKDGVYDAFLEETQPMRVRGFQSFSAGLLLFALEIGLVLLSRLPDNDSRNLALGVTVLPLYFIVSDWNSIIGAARIIFEGGGDENEEEWDLAAAPVKNRIEGGKVLPVNNGAESWNDEDEE